MWMESYCRISELVCCVLIICLIKRKSTLEAVLTVMLHRNLHTLLALCQQVPCLRGGHSTGAATCWADCHRGFFVPSRRQAQWSPHPLKKVFHKHVPNDYDKSVKSIVTWIEFSTFRPFIGRKILLYSNNISII